MNQLPQELIDKIARSLPKEDLKHVLTLSSKFRYAAERYSGAFARYDMNKCNAEKFVTRYSGHRLLYLRELIFRPRLSPPIHNESDPETPCRETKEELRKKDESFTRQIQLLFKTLRSTEERAGVRNSPGRYRLSIYSPTRLVEKRLSPGCLHHHNVSWRVHLLNASELLEIASVHSFEIHNHMPDRDWQRCSKYDWKLGPDHDRYLGPDDDYPPGYRHRYDLVESKLDLRIIVDLAIKFPNLEFLGCKVGGYEWCETHGEEQPAKYFEHDWEGPRRNSRHDFADAVATCVSQLPTSLRRASLDFINPLLTTIDHDEELPDLVSPATKDPFSSSLRTLSNNLRQLQLRVMADESLFWSDGDVAPSWPNLEVLDVMFHVASPTGRWYFQGPSGEGKDAAGFEVTEAGYPPYEMSELDYKMEYLLDNGGSRRGHVGGSQFRIAPDDAKLRPLLKSFAKAANEMPSLKKAVIWSPLTWCPVEIYWDSDFEDYDEDFNPSDREEHAWGIVFVEPGLPPRSVASREEYVPHHSRQLWWRVAKWRPDAELHSLFQRIGRDRFGEDLMESWTDYECGDCLDKPYTFKRIFFNDDFSLK